MFNVKNFIQRMLLAVSLTGAMALTQAEPVSYRLTVNTNGLSGSGYFDANLGSTSAQSQNLTASLSNFAGAFGAVDPSVSTNYMTTANGFSLNNAAPNYLSQEVTFGGIFSFDVLFSGDFLTATSAETSSLLFALYDSAFAQVGNYAGFDVVGFGATRITALPATALVTIDPISASAVPEPTELLLMLTALAMMGVMVKRRQA